MRTEEYLRGYDSCRNIVRGILIKNKELQANEELMNLAQYPYYENDGKDWHPDCKGCKYWDWDAWFDYLGCIQEIKIEEIEDHCEFRKEKEVEEK